MQTNETDAEPWCLPMEPVPVPADVEAALARAERDEFLSQHSPSGRRLPSIFSGREGDEARGR